MSSSYTLSYNQRRRALLSSFSPNLSDPDQFPVATILANRLPILPASAPFEAPELPYPTPPTSPALATADVPVTIGSGIGDLGVASDHRLDPRSSFQSLLPPLDEPPESLGGAHHDSRFNGKKRCVLAAWWKRFAKWI